MLNNPLPSPRNTDADIEPEISTEPVNSEPLARDSTRNPLCASTDAVTEPVAINVDTKASSVNAERGISNKPLPLPLKNEPEFKNTLPLTSIEPVNSEPFIVDSTRNPN